MESEDIIIVDKLTKKFGDFTAVDSISFRVGKGEIFGFLGANGAGKSTAMRMLCGLSLPTSGFASVANYDITHQSEMVKRHIGYMSQKFSLYSAMTARQNIRLFGGIYGMSSLEIKERTEALALNLDFEKEMDVPVSVLPLGYQQKLAFSVATIHKPEVVFLDEPTGGVDPITRRHFWELIYKTADSGTTVFVTTHYMDEAEYCNRVSIMVNGQIKALGSPAELKEEYHVSSMDEVFRKIAVKAIRQ